MKTLSFHLHCAGVLAPGMQNLDALRQASQGKQQISTETPLQLESPARLPANERRRSSQSVRLMLSCVEQIVGTSPFPIETLRAVFATDDGVGEISQQMLEVLSTTRVVSPIVFPNSVHSATAGYFSIAFQNHQPSTVLSRGEDSFAAGLLNAVIESMTYNEPVLLLCFDPMMTAPLDELLPISQPTASVWVISTGQSKQPILGTFNLTLEHHQDSLSNLPSWIPEAWKRNSASKAFSALGLLDSKLDHSYRFTFGAQTLTLELTQGLSA